MTLKFIGHVDASKLDAIRAALRDSPIECPGRNANSRRGFFPDERRPRVLVRHRGSANLAPLAAEIERALEPLGIPREERKFAPHLTLARLKDSHGVEKFVRATEEMKSRVFGSARASEFHLFESMTKPSGAEYKKIESYAFVKGAA